MDEKSLLTDAVAGDRAAQEQLLLEHYDRLSHRVGQRMTGKLAETHTHEDVLQEAFVSAIRDFDKCRARNQAEFGAWLNSVVDNRMRDIRKRLHAQKRGGGKHDVAPKAPERSSLLNLLDAIYEDDPSPSSRVARRDALKALHVGLASLPEDQREAIERRFLQGQSVGGVAGLMKKSPAAVRGLIHRAKLALRSNLGQSSRWFNKKQ